MSRFQPNGMSRRHFLSHVAGASALAVPAMTLTSSIQASAQEMRSNQKAAILLWMSGGPSTIDIWDLKPGASTGGEFRPITTTGEGQISEHLPLLAQQMHNLSIVRSMSTREADHGRGRYYMHTGYVPSPTMEHPSYGSVVAHELYPARESYLEIPPFVSIGGGSVGPGFLGMQWAPFVVESNGQVRNLQMGLDEERLRQRLIALDLIERGFVDENRGQAASDHGQVLKKTVDLMTSPQMDAFKVEQEPQEVRDLYGTSNFGRGCLMARRLVETGVPFVEVDFGGWDNHGGIFPTLSGQKLPEMDQAMSALMTDLERLSMLKDVVVIWMGEFGRTPRINGGAGRDHWARSWSAVVGGGDINGGQVVGATNADGTSVETEPYTSQDLMATVIRGLGISMETTFTSRQGRPLKIANSGKVITELFS